MVSLTTIDHMSGSTTVPPMASRLRITHALLDAIGHRAALRVLHIKGVTLDNDLAEGRHSSTDCDVIVHPRDVSTYLKALKEHGWDQRTGFEHGSVFGHAATLYHSVWGTVDVHRHFPGLDVDPAATFEAWWNDRRALEVGGAMIAVLSPLDQRALLLMHAARNTETHRSHDFHATWGNASASQREALEERVIALGGRTPLMILTDEGDGQRRNTVRDEPSFRLWEAMIRGANPTEVWSAQLMDAPTVGAKIGVLWKAMHVNRDHLAIRLGRMPTDADVRREWVNRLGRGGRRLARMLRGRDSGTS